jgi:hypothetical protein
MPVTNGAVRIHLGKSHEEAVQERLEQYGWTVQPWGQGLLTDEIRAAWQRHYPPVQWRWIPDLIAVRGTRLVLVDPKWDASPESPNFSIEQDAIMAHRAMAQLGLRIVYVFGDFSCNTPEGLVIAHRSLGAERERNGGSGTPYVLVRKADQHPFEDWFK